VRWSAKPPSCLTSDNVVIVNLDGGSDLDECPNEFLGRHRSDDSEHRCAAGSQLSCRIAIASGPVAGGARSAPPTTIANPCGTFHLTVSVSISDVHPSSTGQLAFKVDVTATDSSPCHLTSIYGSLSGTTATGSPITVNDSFGFMSPRQWQTDSIQDVTVPVLSGASDVPVRFKESMLRYSILNPVEFSVPAEFCGCEDDSPLGV
jgi:hypothetical protein